MSSPKLFPPPTVFPRTVPKYSWLLCVAALPTLFGEWLENFDMSLMAIRVLT